MRRTVFFLIAVGAALGLILGGLTDHVNASDKTPIGKVSMFEINDLSGPTSDATVPHHNGLLDYITYTNENGGIVYNDPKTGKEERVIIQFKYADNKARSGPVPTQYARLMGMTPKPILYMPGSSGAAEPSQRWIKRDKVVAYGLPAGVKTWFPPGWYHVVFPDYAAQACAAAKWAMKDWRSKGHKEAPKWAWFTLDLPYGRAPITPESENYIKSLGFEIVGLWTMPFNPVNLSAELQAMYSKGVNYFYGNLIVLQTTAVLKALNSLGLRGKMEFLGMTGCIVEALIQTCGKNLTEGFVGIRYTGNIDELDKPGIKTAKMLAEKNKRFLGTNYLEGVGLGILAVDTLKMALERYGYPINGEQLKAVWENPNGLNTGGIFPHLKFTPEEKRGVWSCHMARIKDGKIVRISEDMHLPDMKPGGPWTPKK